jgi:hypothetical protein
MEQLPTARQSYFTDKLAANKWTVLMVLVMGSLIAAYETARVRDLGFDALRIIVYLPMSIAIVTGGVVVPVLNRSRYKRLIQRYEYNAVEQYWTLTLLHDEHHQIVVHKPPVAGQFAYFGKEYAAQVFTHHEQTWYFPLAPVK